MESKGIGKARGKSGHFTCGQGNAGHLIASVNSEDITVLLWYLDSWATK